MVLFLGIGLPLMATYEAVKGIFHIIREKLNGGWGGGNRNRELAPVPVTV